LYLLHFIDTKVRNAHTVPALGWDRYLIVICRGSSLNHPVTWTAVHTIVRQGARRTCKSLGYATLVFTVFATAWSVAQAQSQQPPRIAATASTTASAEPQSQTPADAATAPPDELQEVTVTAHVFTQDTQKTPITVNVIPGATLNQQGLQSLEQVMADIPSVMPSIGPGGMSYFIRGLGEGKNAPLTSTFVDGISAGSQGPSRYIEYSLFDVSSVQVLEGPQGTLYGRNSVAGAINIITNEPVNRYEESATLGFGNYNNITGNAMLNIPLSDTMQVRAAFSTTRRDGYLSDGQSDENYTAGRLQALMTPTDQLTFRLITDYMTINEHGGGETLNLNEHPGNPWLTPNITIPGASTGVTDYCAIIPISGPGAGNTGKVNNTQSQCALDYYFEQIWHIKGQVNYDLGFAGLTVLGGYEHDLTQQYTQAVGLYPNSTFNQDNQESVEARLASKASSPIQWVFGGYWQRNLSGYPNGYGSESDAGTRISNVTGNWPAAEDDQTTKSLFGQATLPITDRFRLTAGVRYNEDSESETTWSVPAGISSEVVPPNEGAVTQTLTPTPGSFAYGHGKWSKLIWKAGAEFDLAPQSMLYASVATGYSAGFLQPTNVCTKAAPYGGTASNPGCYTSPTVQNSTTGGDTVGKTVSSIFSPIAPNSLINYELGVKNRFFDNRLQVNADVFFEHFSNLQEGSFAVDETGAVNGSAYANLTGTTSRGVELAIDFLATPVDRINFHTTYNPTKIGDSNNPWSNPFSVSNGFQTCLGTDKVGIPIPYGCHQILTANSPLPAAPLWAGNLTYEHTFSLASGAHILAHSDTHFQSSTYGAIVEYPDSFQGSWAQTNLSLVYESADGKWKFSGWVRNVANKAVIDDGQAGSAGKSESVCQANSPAKILSCSGTPVFVDLEAPRTFGFTITSNF
jgi:iron complex outermembrane receptor protein